jgi:hypothetical protein
LTPQFRRLAVTEVAAGHLVGLVELQERKDCGGDVAKAAAFAEGGLVAFFGDVEEGYGVGGVGGVGASGGPVDEHLGVAVIGGDE